MHIDSYKFGEITINGDVYSNDVIVFPGKIKSNWWRKEGHCLHPEDLKEVINFHPDYLIVGQGHDGVMKVPEETKNFLKKHNIPLLACVTGQAQKTFNEYISDGKKAVGAFHLTC